MAGILAFDPIGLVLRLIHDPPVFAFVHALRDLAIIGTYLKVCDDRGIDLRIEMLRTGWGAIAGSPEDVIEQIFATDVLSRF